MCHLTRWLRGKNKKKKKKRDASGCEGWTSENDGYHHGQHNSSESANKTHPSAKTQAGMEVLQTRAAKVAVRVGRAASVLSTHAAGERTSVSAGLAASGSPDRRAMAMKDPREGWINGGRGIARSPLRELACSAGAARRRVSLEGFPQ